VDVRTHNSHPSAEVVPLSIFESLIKHDGTLIAGAQVDGQVSAMARLHVLSNMSQGRRSYIFCL
jgi:hypothetical protein